MEVIVTGLLGRTLPKSSFVTYPFNGRTNMLGSDEKCFQAFNVLESFMW